MNVLTSIERRAPVKLTVDGFLMLKQAGVFSAFSKSELLDGELWGVPMQRDDEPESDAVVPIKLRVEDYSMLDEAGAFGVDAKTELVDGSVYSMSPQYRPHLRIKGELAYRLRRALEAQHSKWQVAIEGSVAIDAHSQPQPDIILTTELRGVGAIPLASVGLLVEVADSTITFDLGEKAQIYAAAGVPEYWVVDINAGLIRQKWSPAEGVYAKDDDVAFDTPITAATIPGLTIETTDL